jgi:hypothetical protein
MAETPILHLSLGTDTEMNRNWQILDDAMHRLAKGVQIPDDLNILGSLDVRDNLHVGGTSALDGGVDTSTLTATDILTGTLAASGRLTGHAGLTIDGGSVVLPALSLDGAALQRGATIQTVGVSAANNTVILLNNTAAQELNRLTLDATEDVGRWQIILVQLSFYIDGSTTGGLMNVVFELRRGAAGVQNRAFTYKIANGTTAAIPLTMVRITQPSDTIHEWSIWGVTGTAGPPPVNVNFSQIHCIQFR